MRVGYLGPPGTFSEEAAREATAGRDAELVPFGSIHETVLAVEEGAVDRALVPVENSLEGGISATLDALTWDARATVIVGESVLAIRNCLIARTALEPGAVAAVFSHPQPLAQCARFLRDQLPGAGVRATASTADAVRTVAGSDEPWAALGPRAAAETYGCVVLREDVDDDAGNATRFVWLARAGEAAEDRRDGVWKTSVVFAGAGDAQPGWLVRCLSEFAFRGVNLTRIESRPLRGRLGHYLFHVDMEGRSGDPAVADAVAALGGHCEEVRVLGTYPAA
ncbi:MAG: prephenate dehydratase [Solirubrobacteraceae bacterium]|jgi:prephenate dehydratase|nr:prephenate dehydratase [Solirubrobacteraceae bacterium]